MDKAESTKEEVNDEYLPEEETEAQLSPMRKALVGTVLGDYFATREVKYLVSFILYSIGFILGAVLIFYAFRAFGSGEILGDNNHAFFGKLFIMLCWISSAFTLASLFATRYSMFLRTLAVTCFIIFLTAVRP